MIDFLALRNLDCAAGGRREPRSVFRSLLPVWFLFLSLRNRLYHILSLSVFSLCLQANTHTHMPTHTHIQALGTYTHKHSECLKVSNLTHSGAPHTNTDTHTDARTAPQRHLHFSRTNFLTLLHSPRLLSSSSRLLSTPPPRAASTYRSFLFIVVAIVPMETSELLIAKVLHV